MGIRENLRKPRQNAQSMLEEDVASGEPARTQQSRKSMILSKDSGYFHSLQLLLLRGEQGCLKHRQKFNQRHFSLLVQPVKHWGVEQGHAQRGQKGLARVPSQPLCHTHPHTLVLLFAFPSGTPQESFAQAQLPLPAATPIYLN